MKKQGGPLQRVGVHVKKEEDEAIKKANDAAKALLDSIGSMAPKEDIDIDPYAGAGMI